jgi:phage terminase large subunit-like protein
MINPTVDSSVLRDEKKRNPALFDCEYGAKFSDTVASWMDNATISKVINEKLPVNPKNGKHGVEYYMGIDYAGKNDGAAISIVHKEGDKIILDYADVYYGSQSDVWWDNHNKMYDTANKLFSGYDIIPL